MKWHYVAIFFLCFTLLFASSCKKKTVGDAKGKITLNIKVAHHTTSLKNITVYLKYNANKYPGNNTLLYDVTAVSDAQGNVAFTQLSLGDYWVYGVGIDEYIQKTVIGNTGIVINNNSVNNDLSISTKLYVSE